MNLQNTNMKVVKDEARNIVNVKNIGEQKQLLGKNSKFKTMYFNFETGKGLPDHVHNGYAAILVYEGKVKMQFIGEEQFELNEGDYMQFDARKKHNVIAEVPSKVLVTISESLD